MDGDDLESRGAMSGTLRGSLLVAAQKTGCSLQEWLHRVDIGQKWCFRCKAWHAKSEFGRDRNRGDGFSAACLASRRAKREYVPVVDPRPGGPPRSPQRDGDKRQARASINRNVRTGLLPVANTVPCVDCGHVYTPGSKRRHEYGHHYGYSSGKHLTAEVVCLACHFLREGARWKNLL